VTEHLPYNEFIVWSLISPTLETVEEVLKNYDEYYNRIYGDFGKLNAILDKMENDGYDNLERLRTGGNRRVVKLIVLLKCTYNTNRDLSRKTIVICRLTVIDKEYECIYSCSLFTDSGELSSIKGETVSSNLRWRTEGGYVITPSIFTKSTETGEQK
jgi:hypothetical protein